MTKRATGAAKAPGSDPGQHLPALARALADKVRPSKPHLTRSEALAACPWDASMPAAWERETRAAYADRLVERGLALPGRSGEAARSGDSGPSQTERARVERGIGRLTLRLSANSLAKLDRDAKRAGWSRAKLIEALILAHK